MDGVGGVADTMVTSGSGGTTTVCDVITGLVEDWTGGGGLEEVDSCDTWMMDCCVVYVQCVLVVSSSSKFTCISRVREREKEKRYYCSEVYT